MLGGVFTLAILELIRRHKLQERYTALWLLAAIGFVLCAVFPQVLAFGANILGVRNTNVALFAVLIGGLVLVVLHLTIVISRQGEQITRLAQELALARAGPPQPRPASNGGRERQDEASMEIKA